MRIDEVLNEVGDSFYDVELARVRKPSLNDRVKREKIGKPNLRRKRSTFRFNTDSGSRYIIELIQDKLTKRKGDGLTVMFSDMDADNGIAINNKGDAIKIFSTVKNVLAKYLSQHPEVIIVGFSAKTSEPSRVKLYQTFANQFKRWFPQFTNLKVKQVDDFTQYGLSIPEKAVG